MRSSFSESDPTLRQQERLNASLGMRLLLVEDNEDIRDALTMVLETEGYDVVARATAEEGLRTLERQKFHLVVTDFALPENSGAWLLRQAHGKGLLANTASLMITAHPDPDSVEFAKVLRKPLDVDDFLGEVYRILAPAREAEMEAVKTRFERGTQGSEPRGGYSAELVLYISSRSPTSMRALRNMLRLLHSYDEHKVRFTVKDLAKDAASADVAQDKIAFTPTLIRRYPEPKTWVLGDLQELDVVVDLLAQSGAEPIK